MYIQDEQDVEEDDDAMPPLISDAMAELATIPININVSLEEMLERLPAPEGLSDKYNNERKKNK